MERKGMKKIPIWAIVVVLVVLLAGVATTVMLQDVFNKESLVSQYNEEEIRAYLAATDSKDHQVSDEEVDGWLKEFLSSKEDGSVEINQNIIIKKGYTVNGTKTITGKGTIVAENSGGGSCFLVNDNSSLSVDGIHIDCNYNMNVGINVKAKGQLLWKGGSIVRSMDYGVIANGQVTIEDSAMKECGVWLELKKGAKADVKNTEFYKCGNGGIKVAKGAECNITGENTLIEQSGNHAIKNEGTFNMTGGNIFMTNGYAIDNFGAINLTGVKQNWSVQGGLVLNEIDAEANLKDCTLWNNTYHVRNYGKLHMENCNLEASSGASIRNEKEGNLYAKDVTVKNSINYALYNNGGVAEFENVNTELILNVGIVNVGSGKVNVDGFSVKQCQGGIENRGSEELGYGEIYANNVTVTNASGRNIFSYGGVCNISNSTLNPSGGYSVYIRGGSSILDSVKILGTTGEGSGGLAIGSAQYTDSDVLVTGNSEITGCLGRGIINYSKLTIQNCDIHHNNVSQTVAEGAGIHSVGEVYMYGGKIHDNHSTTYGGGVRITHNNDAGLFGKLYMYGGEIYHNEAGFSGGGISVGGKSLLEMHGGSVYENRAVSRGDGIVVAGVFNLYDAKRLDGNDVYLTSENTINVKSDELSFDKVEISLENYTGTMPQIVVFNNEKASSKLCDKFVTKNQQFNIVSSKDGGVLVHNTVDFDASYDFSNAQVVTVNTFEGLKEAIESTKPNEIKEIVVAADIVMTDVITVKQRANIKLTDNGTAHQLLRGTDKNLFVIEREAYLVLGGKKGIAIDGAALSGKVAEKSLVLVSNFGYFILEDHGALQNAYNIGVSTNIGVRGAAVNVAPDGSFIMKGGAIINCSSPVDEQYSDKYCAVYGSSSSGISIKGGTISDCNDRAILSYNNVYMSGGTIEDCKQIGSGGAAIRTPAFVMTGGTIKNNLSTNAGSAVYIVTGNYPQGYFKLDGGIITGNKNGTELSTASFGGAVYIDSASVFDFISGTISNNVAGDENHRMACAGILNDGIVNIGKDAIITGNKATLSTGAIYNRPTGKMTIIGATITDNTSTNVRWTDGSRYGSAAAINNEGILVLDGVKVADNHVGTYGTIYSKTGTVILKDMTFTGNVSGANGVITDAYGNELQPNNKGIDVTVAGTTESFTLSGTIKAIGTENAFRLNLNQTFTLADDFSTDSKINLYLHDEIYVGRQILKGNITEEILACFTWANEKDGYYIAEDGCIRAIQMEASIGDVIYVTLEEAVKAAKDGDVITLLSDVGLAKQLVIDKAITITTDGVQDRHIYCEEGAIGNHVIEIVATDKNVVLKGASEDSRLIFDGNELTLTKAFIHVAAEKVNTLTMQYVTMQNITSTYGYGSAICTNETMVVSDCKFVACSSADGATIYCAADLTIKDSNFKECTSNYGGAVYAKGNYKLEVINSSFIGNTAYRGGAIFATDERSEAIIISGCIFGDDSAEGGNIATNAGGAICVANKNVLNITDSTFIENKAQDNFGGAIAMSSNASTVTLSGTIVFENNIANGTGYGGGAIMTGSILNIAENATVTFKNNTTLGLGGGIYFNAGLTPEFTLGKNATLVMADNADKNGNTDIAVKTGVKAAEIRLDGSFKLNNIYTTAGSRITLESNAQDSDIENLTMVTLSANDSGVTAQEGDRLIYNTNVADTIFAINIEEVSYKLDADGYLVCTNPTVELRQNGTARKYATLKTALDKAVSGATIVLLDDITLNEQILIDKSVTITTDGVADRTIRCKAEAVTDNVIVINGADIEVVFEGTTEAQLIFDGTDITLSQALVYAAAGQKVTMEHVVMQNITSESVSGVAGTIYTEVALELNACIFDTCVSNGHGGAVYTKADLAVYTSIFRGCKVEHATTDKNGGAICSTGNHTLTITDSVFTENSADYRGGAVYIETARDEAITISGCTFGNRTDNGNKAANAGGAIQVAGANTINISDSTFVGNEAQNNFGGAVSVGTGASTLNLYGNCVFRDNTAKGSNSYKGGGAIFAPVNLIIKSGAWVEMYGNECSGYASGDAICVNGTTSTANFVVEEQASLFVYDNPIEGDTDNDICVKDGTALTPTANGIFGAWKPVAIIGNAGYETLQSAVDAALDGEIIELIDDVTLNEKLTISKSVTIKTDGVKNRVIYCGEEVASEHVIVIAGADIEVAFVGSADAKLIFDGSNVTLSKAFVYTSSESGQVPAKATLQYVIMQNITSSYAYGSAICSNAPLELTYCEFDSCVTGNRGTVYSKSDLKVENSIFIDCSSTATSLGGGAIFATGDFNVEITDSTFISNTSAYRGAAIYVEVTHSQPIVIDGCSFQNNTATNAGGAIHVANANTLNILDSEFIGNESETYFGGAVSVGTGTSTLNLFGNCVFKNNTAKGTGSYKGGGAIFAPVNFNIKEGAVVEMLGNECSGYATGDAICINGTTSTAKFIIETGAALYVYNNPSAEDVDNDICVKDGSAITPTVNADAIFSTDAPQVVALSSILTTLGICTMKAKKKKKGGVYEKSKK